MSEDAYAKVISLIAQLTLDEQIRLLEDLREIICLRERSAPRHKITELEGLGKEIWEGIDPQEYVDRERASWE